MRTRKEMMTLIDKATTMLYELAVLQSDGQPIVDEYSEILKADMIKELDDNPKCFERNLVLQMIGIKNDISDLRKI